MDTNKAEGKVQEFTGKVQDAAGGLLGDPGTQISGKARELGGKAQKIYADSADIVRNKTTESPFTALAIVGAMGFLLGVLWSSAGSASSRSYPSRYRGNDDY